MLCRYAKNEWLTIIVIGAMFAMTLAIVGWWWPCALAVVATVALLLFFRDPNRDTPSQRGLMVSPADGRVSSIHQVKHFEPFGEPAACVRIFMSVFVVHVNRSPCHGQVKSVTHKPGQFRNALNPDSAEVNTNNLIVLEHPSRHEPVAAVRQVAGLLARTIACAVRPGQILQRGQRLGIIKLGSTVELYIPRSTKPQILVQHGQKVLAGVTALASVIPSEVDTPPPSPPPAPAAPRTAASTPPHKDPPQSPRNPQGRRH